jgi:hypothetical protein
MAKRRKWNPQVFHNSENVSDVKRAIILAHLGELFYKELCSRELQIENKPSIATRSEQLYPNSERKVANE